MNFIKSVCATVVGIMAFFAIMFVFGIIALIGMAASGGSASVPDNSVFVINLDGNLAERSKAADPMSLIMGGGTEGLALDKMVANIKKAKANDKIKGIYLDCGSFSSDSYASLEEIRRQLLDFKKSGKWIVAYGDEYTAGTYYLASVADKVLIHEQGMLDWHGMASAPMLLKDALAKFGVKVTVTKVGKYKSAPEMFTADQISEPNREQITAYVQGIWDNIVKDVAASRKISEEKLNLYADNLIEFSDQKEYIKTKMVDQLVQKDDVKAIVKKMLGLKEDDKIKTVSMAVMNEQDEVETGGDEIAVYYAYGDIVDKSGTGLNVASSDEIIGDKVADDFLALAEDEDVKAVVLRVNSGGGSAFASEKMWQAFKKLKAKKPVVVSMGGMAASGGYYMSCLANWIVAEKTTLTGSIGIFGMFPDFSNLLTEKLGVKYDVIKTNEHSDFGIMYRSINDSEMEILNKYITRGYDLFLTRVAEGRKMTKEQVNEVAQGRVWLGQDAIKHKLVDELGGLDAAIKKAASLAKVEKFHTEAYPAEEDFSTKLFAQQAEKSILDEKLRATLGEFYTPFILMKTAGEQNPVQARVPFVINIK